jgi:hypothetical protein
MNYAKKISVGLASFALFVNTAAPVFAGEINLEVSGNGADSHNTTSVQSGNSTVVSQTNSSNIVNNVSANSTTGGNKADKNTGGDVTVATGDAKTVVSVSNAANTNTADVANCNCDQDANVKISGNGADSKNNAKLELGGSTTVAQQNNSSVKNMVDANSSTGNNNAGKNTGGDVLVTTGDAFTHVDTQTSANSNWAKVGGMSASTGAGASLWITGNGTDSKNDIALSLGHDVLLQQYNSSSIVNEVNADAETGYNKADKNTGGDVAVETGDAHVGVAIDNAANFNWANIDCDCITDVTAKIAGNGFDSKNAIKAKLGNDTNVFQDNGCGNDYLSFFWNHCGTYNSVDANGATGMNGASKNTGDPLGDPMVLTGDSETLVGVENSGNSNVYGATPTGTPLPGNSNGVNVNITFNLSQLLAALGMH